ncbi:LysM peptidoglycan-binding domain-containing protein [Leadbettera azotonutricia]|uniref:LysM domain protein n=1 Tax=Leadbettera azotonutricia (strain ATCC BAA-888 / DSM 13862 / ZAS-9) TaxID=545695 RepID=F5Y8S5_LEAAZ|nr:LysM peptidoglycan-binding domain-containing protein [Leadbettera azotonutricia]AEF81219.1 LysM domain protein [Leadbettera azotonutricia ZAS-9]
MKKISVLCLVALTVFFALSCKTAPSSSSPKIEGDVTQEKVNTALEQIYDTYRTKLIFTDAQDYTVKSGDSLSQITRTYYGKLTGVGEAGPSNGFYFPVIMLASDSHIVDPDLIEPGMKLKVVDLQKNLANPVSRQAIKDCLNDVAYVYNKKGVTATEDGLKKLANSL